MSDNGRAVIIGMIMALLGFIAVMQCFIFYHLSQAGW